MTENPDALAGASDPNRPTGLEDVDTAKQIFPIQFDKDFMDFRPEEVDELVVAPKGGSAPVSVSGQKSGVNQTMGLEDVSPEDLRPETSQQETALPNVGTGT